RGLKEHMQRLGIDLRMLLDHELRTPMASVAGYAQLLRELDPREQPELWRDYLKVLELEANNMLTVIDKLSLALHATPAAETGKDMEVFDGAQDVQRLCRELQTSAGDLIGEPAAGRTRIKYLKATDLNTDVMADRSLYSWAIWEVLKNAVAHSRTGKVAVTVYI